MRNDPEFCFSVGLNDIPWNRLMDWYGRATDFPNYFQELLSDYFDQQRKAIATIANRIEHQDGIIMVTPFALVFLMRLLPFEKADKISILETILAVAKAADYQFEYYEGNQTEHKVESIQQLLAEENILPKFESEYQDEIIWEKWFGPIYDKLHYCWLSAVFIVLQCFHPALANISDEAEAEIANKILAIATPNYLRS